VEALAGLDRLEGVVELGELLVHVGLRREEAAGHLDDREALHEGGVRVVRLDGASQCASG
jgi:hypothetical protein